MLVAYRPDNKKVLRVLRDTMEKYAPGFGVSTVTIPIEGNATLLAALRDRPHKFTYDEGTPRFVEALEPSGTQDWPINTKYDDAASEFQSEIPTLQQALNSVDDISSLAEAKPVLKKMVRAIYALARRLDIDIT